MAVKRVPLQAATAALSALKLFADANGDVIAHAGVKVGSFTRDTSLASGTQNVTGVGFKPSAIILFGLVDGTIQASWGFTDGISDKAFSDGSAYTADTYSDAGNVMLSLFQTNAIYYYCNIASFDADGFTITWTKVGLKTGTAVIKYIAFR